MVIEIVMMVLMSAALVTLLVVPFIPEQSKEVKK